MKLLTTGHSYELENFEDKEESQVLKFVDKAQTGDDHTQLSVINDGTTSKEVLEVLIHRLEYLNSTYGDPHKTSAITHLKAALLFLDNSTSSRELSDIKYQELE